MTWPSRSSVPRCPGRAWLSWPLRAHKLALADGGEPRLVIPAEGAVPRIFTLTRLDRLIPCFASLADALAQRPGAASEPCART
jgi:hypothetical protein